MKANRQLTPEYDKSTWRKGEWDNEPDRVDFIHAKFSCFILRNYLGSWCGYVGVPSNHPYYEKDYNNLDIDVHGGLTYAGSCNESICHIPEEGMPDDVWWLGFDTGHYMDICPSINLTFGDGVYRDMEYMISETKKLAEQLAEVKE
mgnify:CR=1 FL=1